MRFAIPCLIIAVLLILDAALPSVEKERVQVWRVDERVDRSYRRHDWFYGVTGKQRPRRTYLVLQVYREENGHRLRSTLDVSDSFATKLAHEDTLSVRTTPLLGVMKNVRLLRNGASDFTDKSYQALLYLFKVLWLLTPLMALINLFEMRNGYFIALILGAEAFSLYYWYYFIRHLLS